MTHSNPQAFIDGLLYKIGLRGMVFVRVNGKWIRSTRTPDEVISAARQGVAGRGVAG
jgi:hypothetical protein